MELITDQTLDKASTDDILDWYNAKLITKLELQSWMMVKSFDCTLDQLKSFQHDIDEAMEDWGE